MTQQKYIASSPIPNFTEFDGISSDSDLPPTEILSSSPNSTQSGDESFHSKTLPESFPTPLASLYPANPGMKAPETKIAEASVAEASAAAADATQTKATQTKATKTSATQTNETQTDAPEVIEGERRQDRLRMEILELDVEFLRKRNAKLEERIDDLVNTIAIMQRRVSGR